MLGAALVALFTSSGCSPVTPGQTSPRASSCSDILETVIDLIRAGQTGDGGDALSANVERLRSRNCSNEYDIFASYASVQSMVNQVGPDACSELRAYNIERDAIRLLREDGLCIGGNQARGPRVDAEFSQSAAEMSWDEAVGYIGTDQRVCGPHRGTGYSSDDVFINLGRSYPDPNRFTIVLWDVGSVEPPPDGATICASGRITSYEGVAQIELRSISDVEVRR